MKLRIVMPVLNEASGLAQRLLALVPLRQRGAELVLVDGGSTDATWAIARAHADRVLLAPRGRAAQMNAGARGGSADALLFLHADTALPEQADRLIAAALQQGRHWGRFDVRIDSALRALRLVAWAMNLRSRISGIATGDQALFVERRLFEQVGGFAPIALMEDIALSRRLRRHSRPACLRQTVQTSGRRWERHGVWRTVGLMWWLRLAYFLGAAPARLAQRYGYGHGAALPGPSAAVGVLAKAPRAGFAKTRLAPVLGPHGAARAQRRFTLQTLAMAQAAGLGPLALHCAPDLQHRFFRALASRCALHCRPQAPGDLGQRMLAAAAQHFSEQPQLPLLLIGTDCPVLAPGHLQRAARALEQHDVALIGAQDGGYVLIGMRRLVPQVFQGIAWSTPQVMAQTRDRLADAGASWITLDTLWDVDEPADWRRLQQLEQAHG